MTRIGMAIDPDRLRVVARRRARREVALAWTSGVLAVALLGTNVGWLTQRGTSTPVDESALVASLGLQEQDEVDATAAGGAGTSVPSTEGDLPAGSATAPQAVDAPSSSSADAVPSSASAGTASSAPPAQEPAGQTVAPAAAPAGGSNHAAGEAADTPVLARPVEGVWTYDTEGYETVSLGGARHDYPERTFAVVDWADGCEWAFDHRVLEEKRTVSTYCHQGPEQTVLAYDGWITFFGQTAESHYTCTGTRADIRDVAGSQHRSQCTDGSATTKDVTTFLGRESLTVGGAPVEVLAYEIDTVVSGSVSGTSHQKIWLRPSDGLPVRIERDTDTRAREFGADVDYVEHAVFMLASTTPRR